MTDHQMIGILLWPEKDKSPVLGDSSTVERHAVNVNVTGSIPVPLAILSEAV